MPTEANTKYPPNLRKEIKKQATPIFKHKTVMNFSEDKYKLLREKTLLQMDELLEQSSERFLKSQNRIVFEQLLQKSPSIVAER